MTPSKRLGNPVDALNDRMLFSFLRRNPNKGPLSPPSSARAQSPGPSSTAGDSTMPDPKMQAHVSDGTESLNQARALLFQNMDKLAGVSVEFLERLHKLNQAKPVLGKLVRGKRAHPETFKEEARSLLNDIQKSLNNLKIVEAKLTDEPKSSSIRSKGRSRRRSTSPKPSPLSPPPPTSPTPSEPTRKGSSQYDREGRSQGVTITRSATEKLPATSRIRDIRVAEGSSSSRQPKHEAGSPHLPKATPSSDAERYRYRDDTGRTEVKSPDSERRGSYDRIGFRDRDRDRNKARDRDRDYDRERERDRGKDRERERDREKDREQEKDKGREKDRERDKDKDKGREKGREREREREREKDREREREKDRGQGQGQDNDRDREKDRDRKKDRDREDDRERHHHKDYYRDKSSDYTPDKGRYPDKGKDKEREYDRPSTSRHYSEGDNVKDDSGHRRYRYERSRSSPDRRRARPEAPAEEFIPRYVYQDIPLNEVKLSPGVPKAPPTLVTYPGEDEETRRSRCYEKTRERRDRARTTSPTGREGSKKEEPPPSSAPPSQVRYQRRHHRAESHQQYPQSQSQTHLPQQQQQWFSRPGHSLEIAGTLHPPPIPKFPPSIPHHPVQPVAPAAPPQATRYFEMFSPYGPGQVGFQPLPAP